MNSAFLEAMKNRRSYYTLSSTSPIADKEIEEIIAACIKHAPSAYNSQTARVLLLKGNEHKALWDIVAETLREIVPKEGFAKTQNKLDTFANGYASVLYFEDMETVEALQKQFPLYADNFPLWSQHGTGILQFAVWTALEEAGFGASLQHYNPLIDERVKTKWNVPKSWKLIAQMPFGTPAAPPGEKDFLPIEDRFKIYES